MQLNHKRGNTVELKKRQSFEFAPLLSWWRSAQSVSATSQQASASLLRIRKLHSILMELLDAARTADESVRNQKLFAEATVKCLRLRRRANEILRRYVGIPELLDVVPLPQWKLGMKASGFVSIYEFEAYPGSELMGSREISEADAAIALLNLAKHGNLESFRMCDWCGTPILARRKSDRFCIGTSCRDSFHRHRDDRREEKRLAMKRLRKLRKDNPNLK